MGLIYVGDIVPILTSGLIFSKPDQDMPRLTKHRLFISENIVLENLRVNSGINEAEWNRIVGKIFIKFDSNLFDFKLV